MRNLTSLRWKSTYLLAASLFVIALLATFSEVRADDSEWKSLFNGKDLTGWETWLRAPEDQGGKEGEPIGLNKDPLDVFTVKDGEIRVSGEVFGCLSSVESFSDYQIRFDFKWGEKKWPPRKRALRDSGFLYHAHGPHGTFWNAWKACMEYQIQEGDVGDVYPLAVPHPQSLIAKEFESDPKAVYDPEQSPTTTSWRVSHSGKHESPNGQWNTCQVLVSGDHSVHIVNGFVINRVLKMKSKLGSKVQPLTAGHLQFQSEAAEVYYRKIMLRDLPKPSSTEQGLLANMSPSKQEVSIGGEEVTLTLINTGEQTCHVPAVEVFGATANDFHVELPSMPAVVKPGESLKINVHHYHSGQGSATAQAVLRLEGLDGPAENTRILLQAA